MELWDLEFKRKIREGGKHWGIIHTQKSNVHTWHAYIEKRNGLNEIPEQH